MSTTLKADLRRLILQSEADLLAHAHLRMLSQETADRGVADDRQRTKPEHTDASSIRIKQDPHTATGAVPDPD
jgi:hypothetical protein